MHKATGAKATVKRGSTAKRKVTGMHIEAANNGGFISRTHREQPKGRRGMMSYEEPEVNAHQDMAGLQSHIGKTFGGGHEEPDGDE